MNDPVTSARTAREKLAQGLAALQAPGLPQAIQDVAEPIAMAMGALHRIEASHGAETAHNAGPALDAVRRALGMLQAAGVQHPAIDQAMEAVAGSLGLVHSLGQVAAAAAPAPQVQPWQQPAPAPTAQQWQQPTAPAPAQQWQQPQAAPQPAPQQWQQPQAAPQPAPQQWQQPQAAPQPAPQQWQQPTAPAPAQQWQQPQAAPQPAAQQWQQPTAPAPAQQWQQPQAAPASAGGALRVEAELGAHSATNFYKGLSGNDVIDSGGIFVATYNIPEIGQPLSIKVSMPGGYEFEAQGVVRWTRDAPHSGADAPPGYGAQFTTITPEGRQLVYRYVRNREPLFHDDL